MVEWETSSEGIKSLFYKGKQLILPWGIETADSSSFYSSQEGCGYRYQVIREENESCDNHFKLSQEVKMYEGRWQLYLDDQLLTNGIIQRRAKLRCLEPSCFMDFVMRFRFRKEHFHSAEIAGVQYQHNNSNLYYQYSVKQAKLIGPKFQIDISVQDSITPTSMRQHLYVRDAENEWVVHARMLPVYWEKEVIKLCNPWAKTRPLPQFLSNCILKIPGVKDALWYRGEKDPFTGPILKRIQPQAQPIVSLQEGCELLWDMRVSLHD